MVIATDGRVPKLRESLNRDFPEAIFCSPNPPLALAAQPLYQYTAAYTLRLINLTVSTHYARSLNPWWYIVVVLLWRDDRRRRRNNWSHGRRSPAIRPAEVLRCTTGGVRIMIMIIALLYTHWSELLSLLITVTLINKFDFIDIVVYRVCGSGPCRIGQIIYLHRLTRLAKPCDFGYFCDL